MTAKSASGLLRQPNWCANFRCPTDGYGVTIGNRLAAGTGYAAHLYWSGGDAGSFTIQPYSYTNSSARSLVLCPSGGSVGIGTNAPSQKLHVFGNFLFGSSSKIGFNNDINSFVIDGGGTYGIEIDGWYGASLQSRTVIGVFVDALGNVGIGPTATNPDATGSKLQISSGTTANAANKFYDLLKLKGKNNTLNAVGMLFSIESTAGAAAGLDYSKGGIVYGPTSGWGRGAMHFLQEASNTTADADISDSVMTILNDGAVGIGIATGFSAKLHIVDSAFPQVRIEDRSASGESGIRFRSYNGSTGLHGDIFVDATGSETGRMGFRVPWNGTEKLTILHDGNVGIGTSSPATKLDVYGHLNLRSTYNLTWGGAYGANIPSIIGVSGSSPYIVIYPAGSTSGEKLRIAADGTLTVGGNVTVANDTPKLSIKDTNYSNNSFDIDFNGGVSGFFTTNANTYFSFKGGGNEFARIGGDGNDHTYFAVRGNGNVGIGTTAPAGELQIDGSHTSVNENAPYGTSSTHINLKTTSDTDGNLAGVLFEGAVSAAYMGGMYMEMENHSSFYSKLHFATRNAGSFGSKMTLDKSGNVGIGTTAPSALLHLHNSVGDANLRLDASGTTAAFLRFAQSGTTKWDVGSNVGGLTSHQFSFYAQGTGNVVTILQDGKVGIGTTTPTYRLDVELNAQDWTAGIRNVHAGGYGLSIDTTSNTGGAGYTLACYTGQGTGVFVQNNGRLGIGTSQPAAELHVRGPGGDTQIIVDGPTTGDAGTLSFKSNGTQTAYVAGGTAGGKRLYMACDGGKAMWLDAIGLGIGTTSPRTLTQLYAGAGSDIGNSRQLSLTDSNGTNATRVEIGMGYWHPTHTYQPVVLGAIITDSAGQPVSDFYIATKSSTDGDVAPTERFRITKGGNVGIGTTAPAALLHIHKDSSTALRLVRGATAGPVLQMFFGASAAGNVSVRSTGLAFGGGTSEDDIFIDTAGKVGINDITPSYQLDVNGTFRAVGQAYLNGGLRLGGGGAYNVAGERLFNIPYFTNGVGNQKIDLYWTAGFWGYLEIEITGSYSHQNMVGVLTKSFALGLNPSNAIYLNESWYSNLAGLTAGNFAISGVTWDSTNSRYRIQIVHRTSSGNAIRLRMRCLTEGAAQTDTFMSGTTVSAIYTTDTTTFATPVKQLAAPNDNAWVDGYLGIGTATPDDDLHIESATDVGIKLKQG